MTKMFKTINKTWNPVKGCRHNCIYCWANRLAKIKYSDAFDPILIEDRLNQRFKAGDFVFVVDMGDLFGDWVPKEWIDKVLQCCNNYPDAKFLLQTKNPIRFWEFDYPSNVYLGATIETNRDYGVTKAPAPHDRYLAMLIDHPHKFISIEPIMDFDLDILTEWMLDIRPEIVEVGADNYKNNLPEPPWHKVEELLKRLRYICPEVKEKDKLGRLRI